MQPTGVTVKTVQYITVGHCNLAVTNFELATHYPESANTMA